MSGEKQPGHHRSEKMNDVEAGPPGGPSSVLSEACRSGGGVVRDAREGRGESSDRKNNGSLASIQQSKDAVAT